MEAFQVQGPRGGWSLCRVWRAGRTFSCQGADSRCLCSSSAAEIAACSAAWWLAFTRLCACNRSCTPTAKQRRQSLQGSEWHPWIRMASTNGSKTVTPS